MPLPPGSRRWMSPPVANGGLFSPVESLWRSCQKKRGFDRLSLSSPALAAFFPKNLFSCARSLWTAPAGAVKMAAENHRTPDPSTGTAHGHNDFLGRKRDGHLGRTRGDPLQRGRSARYQALLDEKRLSWTEHHQLLRLLVPAAREWSI